uniref:Uncharacterized protein n=1 Tax=Cyanoderma ruficeps TaxID=181631 RepID=A0A8C3XFX2_9PASS
MPQEKQWPAEMILQFWQKLSWRTMASSLALPVGFSLICQRALVPFLASLPGTVQSWPDSYLSDHGRNWPGGHFCSPTCRSPPYQTGHSLPHCSSQGCCQLLLPTGHWPPSPYIYSPKKTLPATTATGRA